MALINCPECLREISDTIKACPHCGFALKETLDCNEPQKVEVTAVNLKAKDPIKAKKLFVNLILVVLVSVILIGGFFIFKMYTDRQAKNEYIDNLNFLAESMLLGASDSEDLCNLIAQVWRDTIYKEYNGNTAKYTIMEGLYSPSVFNYSKYDYEDDFNTSLAKLFEDSVTISKIDLIKVNKEFVNEIMKNLKNPEDDLEKCYETAEELFSAYQGITDLAINPTGNLQTFSQSKNEKTDRFMEYYRRLNTQIPEKNE